MIIDFHTHCYTPEHAQKALALIPKGSQFGPFYDGTLDGLKKSMQKNGVDASLTLHIANQPEYVQKVNDWAVYCNSQDGIYAFGSLHPKFKDYKSEIARLKKCGIKGLKFHPYFQYFDVDDKAMYPIYEAAASEGMAMLFHAGTDIRIIGDYCMPQRFARFCNDFKGAKIVGAHLGGMLAWDEAFDLLLGKDVYLDTSFAFRFLTENQRKRLLDCHDPRLILFGTDGPWVDSKDDLDILKRYISGDSADLILYKNAKGLLEI